MALKSEVWRVLAAKFGGSSASYSKADQFLAETGYSMPGSKGGGKDALHAQAPYLAALLVSTAGLPSEAGAIVRAAHECRYQGSVIGVDGMHRGDIPQDLPLGHVTIPGLSSTDPTCTLANDVARLLEAVAAGGPEAIDTIKGYDWDFEASRIRVDLEPLAAQVEWRTDNGVTLTHYYLTPKDIDALRDLPPEVAARQMARPRRSGVLPMPLLFTAAELLADSWAKAGRQPSFLGAEVALSDDAEAPASAPPLNEKTPDPARSEASNRHNQSREPKTGHSHTPANNISRAHKQARTGSRGASPRKGFAHEVR